MNYYEVSGELLANGSIINLATSDNDEGLLNKVNL